MPRPRPNHQPSKNKVAHDPPRPFPRLRRARASTSASSCLADEPRSVSEIQATHDRALIRDLVAYLGKTPKPDDIDQAYLTLFNKVIEHDWFVDNEAIARSYLKEYPDGPVRPLAQIIATMGRARRGRSARPSPASRR